jgi:N-acyl-L-homoserine lactone synthetase
MLHVLRSGAGPAGDHVLHAMFSARKSVFVDLLKWNVPVVAGTYERDRFDDAQATYLVLTNPTGAHLGSARLLKTDRPYILDSCYRELCIDRPPSGPGKAPSSRTSGATAPQELCRAAQVARDDGEASHIPYEREREGGAGGITRADRRLARLHRNAQLQVPYCADS